MIMKFIVLYFAIGIGIALAHVRFVDVGAKGVLFTLAFGTLAWPFFVGYWLNKSWWEFQFEGSRAIPREVGRLLSRLMFAAIVTLVVLTPFILFWRK